MIENDDESLLWRRAPLRPYRATTDRLEVPRAAWEMSLAVCRAAGRRETGLFWYGKREPTTARVLAVVVPRQRQTWGNYQISADAMREVHERVASLELRNVAQVHSHPGVNVEHSGYDDDMANSRRALSLVLPRYGQWQDEWPRGIGVHEFQDDYWHLLSDEAAASRAVIVDDAEATLIDCRD